MIFFEEGGGAQPRHPDVTAERLPPVAPEPGVSPAPPATDRGARAAITTTNNAVTINMCRRVSGYPAA